MAKATQRALVRKPRAVIVLSAERGGLPDVLEDNREFEWFSTAEGMNEFYDQMIEFAKQDTADYDDWAYLLAEIDDTKAEPMVLGRVQSFPVSDETKKWQEDFVSDPSRFFSKKDDQSEDEQPKKKVRARKPSTASKTVQKGAPAKKSAATKAPAKKSAAKKAASSKTAGK